MADGVDMSRLAADSAERLRLFAERQGVTFRIETPGGWRRSEAMPRDSARSSSTSCTTPVKFSPDGG
jgi:hypothetical protein